jgi:hypothetical protein
VDPHTHPERFGDSPDPNKHDEPASYLRRLESDRDAVDVMGFDSFRQPRAGQSYDPE